jgi:hypothetical protein
MSAEAYSSPQLRIMLRQAVMRSANRRADEIEACVGTHEPLIVGALEGETEHDNTQSNAQARINTDDPPPCPRQESNLDLPLRRTKDGTVGLGVSLGTATVSAVVSARACPAMRHDWAGFRQGSGVHRLNRSARISKSKARESGCASR